MHIDEAELKMARIEPKSERKPPQLILIGYLFWRAGRGLLDFRYFLLRSIRDRREGEFQFSREKKKESTTQVLSLLSSQMLYE